MLRSAQPRNLLDPFANMCEQDADDPVKYRGFHPVYSPGSKVPAQPEPPLNFPLILLIQVIEPMIFSLLVFAPSTNSGCESDNTTEPDLERSSEPPHKRLKTMFKKKGRYLYGTTVNSFSFNDRAGPAAR